MPVPPNDSLPHDHITTLAWFLSRSNRLAARSSRAGRHSGRSPGTAARVGLAEVADAIPEAVRLEVHLVDDEKAVAIRELVEEGVVRIVARADRVHVDPLEGTQVFLGLLAGHHATLQPELVPIHTVQHHAAAVEPQQAVLDRESTDADRLRNYLGEHAVGVTHLDHEVVQRRRLRAPQPRIGHADREDAVVASGQLSDAVEVGADRRAVAERDRNRTSALEKSSVSSTVTRRSSACAAGRRRSTTSRNRPEKRYMSWSSSHEPLLHLIT